MLFFLKNFIRACWLKDEPIAEQRAKALEEFKASRAITGVKTTKIYKSCNQLSSREGEFGHSQNNPIPVNRVKGSIIYLSRLRCNCANALFFHRLGSMENSKMNIMVDVYETVCTIGNHWDILFLHMYHPRRSKFAPRGYSFARCHPIFSKFPFAYGTNLRTNDFPFKLSDSFLSVNSLGNSFKMRFTANYDKMIEDKSKFIKPQEHQEKLRQIESILTFKAKIKINET